MPSSYTANGGIELPANGEQSGSWGTTVNDNMLIVDRLTNGIGSVTLSGTAHTLATSNGILSAGQYKVLVLGGVPSGTNTVTITPNTGQHIYVVKNASGQTAIFSQGSGANVSVLNGKTKIIYSDGAGAGAAVVDITGAIDLGSLTINGVLVTSTSAELNILDGVTSTTAELNILDGVTATTAEINKLDGVTSTTAELNLVDGSVAGTIVNNKAVVYSAAGQVNATSLAVGGSAITATPAELNILDGVTATTAEINILDGVTSTAAELNLVDGAVAGTVTNSKAVVYSAAGQVNATSLAVGGVAITSTPAELNILDGVTSTTAELNLVDGSAAGTIVNSKAVIYSAAGQVNGTTLAIAGSAITATAAELNKMDGVTATTAELNILDGVTATTAELNYADGVTSNIQTQLNTKAPSASPTLTSPTLASVVTITGGTQSWTVTAAGTNLTFAYNGTNVMRVDSTGNITAIGNVTAYGSVV